MLISGTEYSEHALDLDFQQLLRAPLLKLHPVFAYTFGKDVIWFYLLPTQTRQKPDLVWPEKGESFLQSVEKTVLSTESVSPQVCVFSSPVGIQVLNNFRCLVTNLRLT